jgi:hypothetical protein
VPQQTTDRLEQLPADQRAALTLIVRQGKSYTELAGVLGIDEQAVHDRAHAALAMLAPARARRLTAEQRALIGDHVLGQDAGPAQAAQAQDLLASSADAREWAQALRAELAPLASGTPAEERLAVAAPAPASANGHHATGATEDADVDEPVPGPRGPAVRSSRVGGAILLALLVAGIVVAVVLLSSGGGSGKNAKRPAAAASGPRVTAQFPLQAVERGSKAAGAVEVLQDGSKRAFFMIASHLPPTNGFYYAIWLYNSQTSHEAVSRAPSVGSKGSFEGGSFLPEDAAHFKYILLTRETSASPRSPGHVVLASQFSVGS